MPETQLDLDELEARPTGGRYAPAPLVVLEMEALIRRVRDAESAAAALPAPDLTVYAGQHFALPTLSRPALLAVAETVAHRNGVTLDAVRAAAREGADAAQRLGVGPALEVLAALLDLLDDVRELAAVIQGGRNG
jgi:hypothetical protein